METKNEIYVKLHNIVMEDETRGGYRLVCASSGSELMDRALEVFHIPPYGKSVMELWSSTSRMSSHAYRVDQLEQLPPSLQFVWMIARP